MLPMLPRRRRGFTLLEATLTTVIIGVGVVASLAMFQACARANAAGANMTSALLLADNAQELLARYPFDDPQTGHDHFGPEPDEPAAAFDDLDDFDGLTFSPPVDGARRPIRELAHYRQLITINPVLPSSLSANANESVPDLPKSAHTGAVRVRVRILHQPKGGPPTEVHRASFLRFDR
jgi:type II secretory pathway pseudopilin PulG